MEGPMTMRTVLLSCAAISFFGVVPGPLRAAAGEKAKVEPSTRNLSGRWVYNREASDDVRQKMREGVGGRGGPGGGGPGGGGAGGPGAGGVGGPGGGMGGPGGGMGRGGPVGPPPGGIDDDDARESMSAIFEPAEEIAVTQSPTEVTIDEKYGRTRRLHPDGKKYKTENGMSEVKTAWKEGKLVVETRRDRGTGVTETWELVPDGSRIIVNVKMQGGFGPSVELKRVYDRAKDAQ
jgi:hypothetical protein